MGLRSCKWSRILSESVHSFSFSSPFFTFRNLWEHRCRVLFRISRSLCFFLFRKENVLDQLSILISLIKIIFTLKLLDFHFLLTAKVLLFQLLSPLTSLVLRLLMTDWLRSVSFDLFHLLFPHQIISLVFLDLSKVDFFSLFDHFVFDLHLINLRRKLLFLFKKSLFFFELVQHLSTFFLHCLSFFLLPLFFIHPSLYCFNEFFFCVPRPLFDELGCLSQERYYRLLHDTSQ